MEPLISIVLPIYNGEKYMRMSIDSILSQTYNNWELLMMVQPTAQLRSHRIIY